jgi:hypothetical protein
MKMYLLKIQQLENHKNYIKHTFLILVYFRNVTIILNLKYFTNSELLLHNFM